MEAIGRLAGGIAHDFNNLLAVITGYSDLLLESLASSDLDRRKVEQIKQAANSAAEKTKHYLTKDESESPDGATGEDPGDAPSGHTPATARSSHSTTF
jgi:hypothetical protein